MKTLRILHVDSASEYRGGQNQARLLMEGLREATDVRQGLLAARRSRLDEEASRLGVETYPVGWRSPVDPRPLIRLRGLLRSGWDVVHAHDSHGLQTALAARALSRRRIPVVASRRVSVPMRSPAVWNRADAIIAVSTSVRQGMLEQGIEASRLRVIHDGLSSAELSIPDPGRLRKICQVSPAVPLVGAVGALTPEKGHAWLLRSAARVTAAIPEARFAIFGEGPERDRLTRLVVELDLEDRVAMPGHVDRIGPSLCDLDLFVMPSLSEGMGTAALEAMFAGCPAVFSAAGGLEDLAGADIPTVEPGDVAGLASAMIRLLKDATARNSLSRQVRERSASYTTERTTGATLELYRQLAGTR